MDEGPPRKLVMFYYLGRKKRLAHLYPEPLHDTIVEPFAGSAAYSLHGNRWQRHVIINDLSPITCGVWRYLQDASVNDIMKLPEPQPGEKLSDYKMLSEDERWLISFHINIGTNRRSNVVTPFSRWPAGKRYILGNLHKIKHWTIVQGSYDQLYDCDVPATYFVDPPYHRSGKFYMVNEVNYDELAKWCLSRNGQVIVCEQSGASWLPFDPLASIAIAGKHRSDEVMWTNVVRPTLF